MAWQKKGAAKPADVEAAEEAAEAMPMMPAKKKVKGKMPPPDAAKPAWRKIADQMAKK